MSLRMIIAGGGTGGHVYPALPVIEELRKSYPNGEFLWIGNPDKVEARVTAMNGIRFQPVRITGLSRRYDLKGIIRNIGAVFNATRAMRESRKIISSFKPHIAMGTGGYVSGPPIAQASKMGIRTILIEPNSYPGLTVKWLAKRVDRIFQRIFIPQEYTVDPYGQP